MKDPSTVIDALKMSEFEIEKFLLTGQGMIALSYRSLLAKKMYVIHRVKMLLKYKEQQTRCCYNIAYNEATRVYKEPGMIHALYSFFCQVFF